MATFSLLSDTPAKFCSLSERWPVWTPLQSAFNSIEGFSTQLFCSGCKGVESKIPS